MPPTAREIARQVLLRARRDRAYVSLTLAATLARHRATPAEERALATELVYGVLRHRRLLDHALSRHTRRPLRQLNPEVHDALRVAAYQVLMLDRVPAHAAVNEAVGAVRNARGQAVAGFANAVLRRLGPDSLVQGLPPEGSLERWAVECSVPDWLARSWERRLGADEAPVLARAMARQAPLCARVNLLRSTVEDASRRLQREGASVERGRLAPEALRLSGLRDAFRGASYLDGSWTAQDEGAQVVARLLDPRPGETVLDACSGVGGKATHAAALMQDRGSVICVDHSQRKLQLAQENALRLRVTITRQRRADLLASDALQGIWAHRVLLDAPCSGLGVLRRHPELKWRLEPDEIGRLARLQRRLLKAVVAALRPGGVLVYSVCTTTEEEGPEQARWVQQALPQLAPCPHPGTPLPELAEEGRTQLWPHRHGSDGFYLARFRKRDQA
jgi:16S rRNA (cytosine967-C5)-methyltransferase